MATATKPFLANPAKAEHFWSKVAKCASDACWVYQGVIWRNGYGAYSRGDGRTVGAHRFAYSLTHGEIPPHMVVAHHCDNPPCCNPEHLFLCTQSENVADCWRKGRGHQSQVGEKCVHAKLTEGHVRAVRALASSAVPHWQIGEWFGVATDTVSRIVNRRGWVHVD